MGISHEEFMVHTSERLDKLVPEYMDEAEHQDGSEYWAQFDTVEEAFNDFVLYLGNITGVIS